MSDGLFKRVWNDRVSLVLLCVALTTGVGSWLLARHTPFGDQAGYLAMSEGLRRGVFSSWYEVQPPPPETLRTPGYPLFVAALRTVHDSVPFIAFVQLLFAFATLVLALKLTDTLSAGATWPRRVFLLLAAINIQVPYFSGQVGSDGVATFFVTLWAWLLLTKPAGWKTGVWLGLAAGTAFALRPSLALMPLVGAATQTWLDRARLRTNLVHLGVFALTTLPFGVWNLQHHGVFKVTPLEGGGGAASLGYWNFRVTPGYSDRFYWGNAFIEDALSPLNPSVEDGARAIVEYEAEWAAINQQLEATQTDEDRARLAAMHASGRGIPVLHTTAYTRLRETLLMQQLLRHVREEPWFYARTRLYTFVRSYYTGIGREAWRAAGTAGKLKILAPPVIQVTCILGGLLASVVLVITLRRSADVRAQTVLLAVALSFGAVHMPFVIGARYTMPAHLLILSSLATLLALRRAPKS